MGRIEKTVFISYRRTDESWGLAIFQDLTQHGYDVFIDYDGIASGNFEAVILENIKARAHFLILLTPTALERCSDPEDWMRREIEAALDSQRNVVPLLLAGFDFDTPATASQLTGKLAALKKYNGLPIPKGYFSPAMERLRNKFLSVQVDAVLHPTSDSAQQVAKEQKDKAGKALHQPSLSPEEPRKQEEAAAQYRAEEERKRAESQAKLEAEEAGAKSSEQPKTATVSSIAPSRIIAGGAIIVGVIAIVVVAVWRTGPSVSPQPVPRVTQAAPPLTAQPAPSVTAQTAPPVTQPTPPVTAQTAPPVTQPAPPVTPQEARSFDPQLFDRRTNTEIRGGNFYTGYLSSADDCARYCAYDVDCKAYTYNKPQQICHRYHSLADYQLVENADFDSGIRQTNTEIRPVPHPPFDRRTNTVPFERRIPFDRRTNTEIRGGNAYLNSTSSVEDCRQICTPDASCKAYSYNKPAQLCRTLHSLDNSQLVENANFDSGIRQ